MPKETPVLLKSTDLFFIILNRLEAKDAANLALSKGVAAALDRLDADDALGVGLIGGTINACCNREA